MSGRIRTIKPELLEDAVTANLSDMAFRLFVGVILLADDYGNLRAEPHYLRGQVFWARDVSPEDMARALEALCASRLLVPYLVAGQRYASIRTWGKHQKVQHPGKPRVPGPSPEPRGEPPESLAPVSGDSPESLTKPSGEPPEGLAPDHRSPTTDPDRDPDPSVRARGRLVDVGTAAGEETVHAYASAVASAQGAPFSLRSRDTRGRQALADAVNGHSGATTLADALAWLQGAARAYVAAVLDADARAFHLGYPPERFLAWISSGRPALRPPRGGRAIVQPADNRCWDVPPELA